MKRILTLKEYKDHGNKYADECSDWWMHGLKDKK
jgi:hypothetical protein